MVELGKNEEILNLFLRSERGKAIYESRKAAPRRLFKLCKLSHHAISSLETETIWMSSPMELNDPYDCMAQVAFRKARFKLENAMIAFLANCNDPLLEEQVKRFIKENIGGNAVTGNTMQSAAVLLESMTARIADNRRRVVQEKIANIRSDIPSFLIGDYQSDYYDTLRIYSLTENYDDVLMWAHYADSNSGICIEYDIEPYFATMARNKIEIIPVVYWDKMFSYTDYPCDNFYPSVMIKDKIWEYEKEWRLVTQSKDHEFPQPNIKKIYLGPYFRFFDSISTRDEQLVERLIKICQRRDIEIYRMKPQVYSKTLDPMPIT